MNPFGNGRLKLAPAYDVIDVVNTWQQHLVDAGVSARDIATLAERIDGEALLSQRVSFDEARFQSAPTKRKRASPFRRG